jgi:hypothetical protein
MSWGIPRRWHCRHKLFLPALPARRVAAGADSTTAFHPAVLPRVRVHRPDNAATATSRIQRISAGRDKAIPPAAQLIRNYIQLLTAPNVSLGNVNA